MRYNLVTSDMNSLTSKNRVIYLLKSKLHATVLIVAIEEVDTLRDTIKRQGFAKKPAGNPTLFHGLSGWKMLDGTAEDAAALRARFPRTFLVNLKGGAFSWNEDSPELRGW